MGLLTELIQRNAWQELYECLLSFPQSRLIAELFMTDRLGRTPLHYACAKKQAPQHVVALMLHHVGQKWFSSRDICGNTPLHAAAANGNAQIVSLLLESLHSRRLQYVNDVGSTPLLMAWKKYLNPTSTLFGHVNARGRTSYENIDMLTHVQDALQLQQDDECHRLQDVWNKTIVLVAHASNKGGGSPSIMKRPLHELLVIGGKRHVQCPTVAYWLAIRLYPHHLHLNDEHGNLAIHLAAKHNSLNIIPMLVASHNAPSLHEQHGNELSIVNATESALTQLSKAYPKGAVTPNRQDRLPIHLAIESGKAFENGIHALVQAAPQTLEQRDSRTKLYPFLLAAASPKAPLTVVWELIRARPDLIRVGITRASPCKKRSNNVECPESGFKAKKIKMEATKSLSR